MSCDLLILAEDVDHERRRARWTHPLPRPSQLACDGPLQALGADRPNLEGNPEEYFAVLQRGVEFRVELSGGNVFCLRCPLNAAAVLFTCHIKNLVHEACTDTVPPVGRSDIQLFEVQRASYPSGGPQERIGG